MPASSVAARHGRSGSSKSRRNEPLSFDVAARGESNGIASLRRYRQDHSFQSTRSATQCKATHPNDAAFPGSSFIWSASQNTGARSSMQRHESRGPLGKSSPATERLITGPSPSSARQSQSVRCWSTPSKQVKSEASQEPGRHGRRPVSLRRRRPSSSMSSTTPGALPPRPEDRGFRALKNLASLSMLGNRFMLAAQYLVSESARSSIQTTATTSAASTKIGRLA
jgi:hypothetical protein